MSEPKPITQYHASFGEAKPLTFEKMRCVRINCSNNSRDVFYLSDVLCALEGYTKDVNHCLMDLYSLSDKSDEAVKVLKTILDLKDKWFPVGKEKKE